MLGSNTGQLRLRHWLSDALSNQAKYHPHSAKSLWPRLLRLWRRSGKIVAYYPIGLLCCSTELPQFRGFLSQKRFGRIFNLTLLLDFLVDNFAYSVKNFVSYLPNHPRPRRYQNNFLSSLSLSLSFLRITTANKYCGPLSINIPSLSCLGSKPTATNKTQSVRYHSLSGTISFPHPRKLAVRARF